MCKVMFSLLLKVLDNYLFKRFFPFFPFSFSFSSWTLIKFILQHWISSHRFRGFLFAYLFLSSLLFCLGVSLWLLFFFLPCLDALIIFSFSSQLLLSLCRKFFIFNIILFISSIPIWLLFLQILSTQISPTSHTYCHSPLPLNLLVLLSQVFSKSLFDNSNVCTMSTSLPVDGFLS